MRRPRDVAMLSTCVQLTDGVEVEKCVCGDVNSWFRRHYQFILGDGCVVSVVVEGYFFMSGDWTLPFR